MQQSDGLEIMDGRCGRGYRLTELPHFSVNGYCHDSRSNYGIFGRFYHEHTRLPFRDVSTLSGDTLEERYE